MATNFRDTPGKLIDWIDTRIQSGFSNFVYVDRVFYSCPVMRRIFSYARKLGYRSLIIEEVLEKDCPLLEEENVAIRKRLSDYDHSKVYKLLFLRSLREQNPSDDAGDLLGYSVFKADFDKSGSKICHHTYEAVLKPSREENENNFIRDACVYEIETSQGRMHVPGVIYAQQNDLTCVCAHVALRSSLACVLPEQDVTYPEINKILGIDHIHKLTGTGNGVGLEGKGLGPEQMKDVLSAFDIPFTHLVHEPNEDPPTRFPGDFQRDLYGIIESKQPALLGFELGGRRGGRHIIPVIGHTFNEDTWVADATRNYFPGGLSYYPSENWLSTYVVHDDNFGPYFCLPRHFLEKKNFRIILGFLRWETPLGAVDAEALGLTYLNATIKLVEGVQTGWLGRFVAFGKSGLFVLRTLLLTKEEYLNHLDDSICWDGKKTSRQAIELARDALPERFWMIEASAPELFSASRRKFGEVLMDATKPAPKCGEQHILIAARVPSFFFAWSPNDNFKYEKCGTDTHIELFRYSNE